MAEANKEEKKPRRRVKKVKGGGGHHGGAWKVAYADFVTAMMALFLVLWLVSQADTKLKQELANYFRDPGIFDSKSGGLLPDSNKVSKEPPISSSNDNDQALFDVAQRIQKEFETSGKFGKYKDQIKVEVTDEGLKIQLLDKAERVSFPSGSSELTSEARAILTEIASEICALPNQVNIGGHTDSHVYSSANGYTNWELSADRANAARRALLGGCVKPEQLHRIIGYADTEPLDTKNSFAAQNRRISITVLRLNDPNQTSEQIAPEKNSSEKENKTFKKIVDKLHSTPTGENHSAPKTNSTEKKTANSKTAKQESISVGEPDKIPEGIQKTIVH
jgi:chemotaxis protein MotB